MTDAVEAARVALARTGTIIPKMGFGDDLEAAEVQLDACEAKLDAIITRLGGRRPPRRGALATPRRRAGARWRLPARPLTRGLRRRTLFGAQLLRWRTFARPRRRIY